MPSSFSERCMAAIRPYAKKRMERALCDDSKRPAGLALCSWRRDRALPSERANLFCLSVSPAFRPTRTGVLPSATASIAPHQAISPTREEAHAIAFGFSFPPRRQDRGRCAARSEFETPDISAQICQCFFDVRPSGGPEIGGEHRDLQRDLPCPAIRAILPLAPEVSGYHAERDDEKVPGPFAGLYASTSHLRG